MKTIALIFVILFCYVSAVGSVFADIANVNTNNQEATKIDKAELRERFLSRTGGFIPNKKNSRGSIAIISAQKFVSNSFIKARAEKLESQLWFNVNFSEADMTFSMTNVRAMSKVGAGNVSILLVETSELPALVHLPEDRLVIVNVTALAKGSVDKKTAEKRIAQEISRAAGFVLGLGYSKVPGGVMSPYQSVEELDDVLTDILPADLAINADFAAANFGITRFTRITYRKACMEGWAPKPKNIYQKKIYDEVYEIPSKPIQIKYKGSQKK
jgi:hypothetical protein